MTCDKVSYSSKAEAMQVLNSTTYRNKDRTCVRAYCCRDCGKWHHTSQSDQKRNVRKSRDSSRGIEKMEAKYKKYKTFEYTAPSKRSSKKRKNKK